ncbi:MAG: Uma2 family endonuclease [Anaerolineae bacterium]
MSAAVQEKLMTGEELLHLPDDGYRYELVKGELIKMAPPGAWHGVLAVRLGISLGQYVQESKLGEVAVEAGYYLARDPDTVRGPDISFVSRERILPEGVPKGFWPFAPDLAVEIVSPSDTAEEVMTRVSDYLRAGTRLVWVVQPATKTVTEYRSFSQVRVLTEEDTLEGGEVLPGFACPVAEIFR